MKVAIIERHLFGGTCVNVGCIPTKTLVASARAAYVARRAAVFGVKIDGPISVDMKKVKERKDGVVRRSNQGVEKWLKSMENATVYEGHARFEGPHTVRVGEELLEADKIFINVGGRAVGRRPNTDDLGLEKAGIAVDSRGYIVVDDQLRTNVPGVWALGDCNGKGAFTHTSYNDFEIVAANLLDNDPRRVSDRIPAYALYVDPPLGRAGMTKAQARGSGRKVLAAKRPMSRVSRAIEKGETQGFMSILVDAGSKEILGAAVLEVGGDEIIHSILDVMYAKAPYTVIQRAVHIHPTVTELIPTMLGDLKPLE